MNTKTGTVCVLLLAIVVAFKANSEEPQKRAETLTFNTSELGKELLETLNLNYKQRLDEYKDGRSTPVRLIEVNRDLYETQRGSVASKQRQIVAEAFLERSKEIEAIAEQRLRDGVGTSMDVLDAKASRIRATIEHETVARFTAD